MRKRKSEEEENMRKISDEAEKFGFKLISKCHTCVVFVETYPLQIKWCEQNPCKNLCGWCCF
jgi:hypothetical protein